jgi:hypothetical protein
MKYEAQSLINLLFKDKIEIEKKYVDWKKKLKEEKKTQL